MLKAVSSVTNALGALNYKGTWSASSNTPTLADGTGAKGDYYVVSTAGTQTFGGVQLFFGTGDWIAYNGAVWQRVEGGSDGNFANVTLTSTDAGATASPLLELYRDSASPAASDTLGEIEFNGEDSAGNKQAYGLIHASILSPTSTAEQGQLHFETATAGALTEKMIIGTTNLVINEIGAVFNVRIEGDTDANLFYTDATNSRVGIGTISPSVKFEVSGAANITGTVTGGTFRCGATNTIGWTAQGGFESVSDGVYKLYNEARNAYGALTLSYIAFGTGQFFYAGSTSGTSTSAYTTIAGTDSVGASTSWNVGVNAFRTDASYAIQNSGGTGLYLVTGNTAWTATSDERLKDIIEPITNAVDKVKNLRTVIGKFKNDENGKRRPFLMAQDFLNSLPEVVDVSDPESFGLMYSETIVLAFAAIKELAERIEILEAKG